MDLLEAALTQQTRNLARNDVDGRTGHETTDSRSRDELDNPAPANETNAENDEAADKGQSCGDLRTFPATGIVAGAGG